jgi:hypothetical protein
MGLSAYSTRAASPLPATKKRLPRARETAASSSATARRTGRLAGAPSTLERLELLEVELPSASLRAFIDRQQRLRTLHLEDDLPDDLAGWLAQSPVLATLALQALVTWG